MAARVTPTIRPPYPYTYRRGRDTVQLNDKVKRNLDLIKTKQHFTLDGNVKSINNSQHSALQPGNTLEIPKAESRNGLKCLSVRILEMPTFGNRGVSSLSP